MALSRIKKTKPLFNQRVVTHRFSCLAMAVLGAIGVIPKVSSQNVIDDGVTVTINIANSQQFSGQSFVINAGGTLVNEYGGMEINGVDLKQAGTLNLTQSLLIGTGSGVSILAGVVTSSAGDDLVIEGDTSITAANAGLGSLVQVREGALLSLSATGALGAPAEAGIGIDIETGSAVRVDADNAIEPNRTVRVEGTAVLTLNANQAFANIYSEAESQIEIAAGKALTVNTTGTWEDGDLLYGDITGQGSFVFSGDGYLDIIPDIDFGGVGGQTTFTGLTIVDGGGTLSLGKQGALGGSTALNVSNGSSVVIDTIDNLWQEVYPPELIPSADNALNTAINIDLDSENNTGATLTLGTNQTVNSLNTGTGSSITIAQGKTLTVGSQGGNSTIAGAVSGLGGLTQLGGTTTVQTTGTTFTGSTKVEGGAILNLSKSGALGGSNSLVISEGSTVNLRATNSLNDNIAIVLDSDNNLLDIRGTNSAGRLVLPEGATLSFTSNSSAAQDALVLKATTGQSDISGTVTGNAAGTLTLDGATAVLNSQLPSSVTLRIQNDGHLIINRTNAYLGTLALNSTTASKVTVNADNGLNTTGTNKMLVLPGASTVVFNANQTLDLLSTSAGSEIDVESGYMLTIANISNNVFASNQKRSFSYGQLAGGGDIALTGGILDIGAAGVSAPVNSLTGAFSVSGASTLNLHKTGAVSGSSLLIGGGSTVSAKNSNNVFNDNLDVTLSGAGDRLIIDTFTQSVHRIDSLNLASGSLLDIGSATSSPSDPHTLTIGTSSGDSLIAGDVTGDGNLTITGGGTTRIEKAMELGGDIKITKENGNLVLATSSAFGNNPAVYLSGSNGLTLTLDAENAWDRQTVLNLPATATLEVNASQTINELQSKFPVLVPKGQSPRAAPILLTNDSVLTLGEVGGDLEIEGIISGKGSLVFAAGATSLSNDPNPNTFTGNATVKNGATLSLTTAGALGGAAELVVESGGTVNATASDGNTFNDAINVQIQSNGLLNLQSIRGTGTFVVNSVVLEEAGSIYINPGDSLYIGSDNGDSLIAGTIGGLAGGRLSIGGSGTTLLEAQIEYNGDIEITDTARVVVAAVDAFGDGTLRSGANLFVGAGTTLDLAVTNAFADVSEDGFTIASGTRINVNASNAISPTGSFTFADGESILAFNNVAQTFGGQLSGGGQLLVTGAAQLTLSGANGSFTGVTRLQDSSVLNVNGSSALGGSQLQVLDQAKVNFNADYTVQGPLRVDGQFGGTGTVTLSGADARLSGVGSFANPVVVGNGATHAPGNSVGTQTFVNYALDGGATLESEFEISNNQLIFDQVVVTADGQIGQNGTPTIEVIGLPTNWVYGSGTRYELITTEGNGELAITNLPELQTTFASSLVSLRLGGDAQAIWLETLRRSYASIQTRALSVNEFNAATGLDNVLAFGVDLSDSDVQAFFESLDGYAGAAVSSDATATDISTYQSALNQVSGQRLLTQDAAYLLGVQSWNNRLGSYLQEARQAGVSEPIHVSVYGSWATNQNSSYRSGFDTDTFGLIFSGERSFAQGQYAGFALGYENSNTTFKQFGGSSKVQAARMALSYAYVPQARWELRAMASAGYAWISSSRPQQLFEATATGKATAWDTGLQLEGSYKILDQSATRLSFLAGMQSIYAQRQAFNETGAVTALNVASRTLTSNQSKLGLELAHDFAVGKQSLLLDAKAYWLYDFSGSPSDLQATFAMGAPQTQTFNLVDSGLSKNSVWMDIGISADFNQQFSGRLSYQGQFGSDYSSQAVSAELLFRF